VRASLLTIGLMFAVATPAFGSSNDDAAAAPDPAPTDETTVAADALDAPNTTVDFFSVDAPITVDVPAGDPNLAATLGDEPGASTSGPAVRGAAVQVGPEFPPDPDLAIPPNSGEGRRVVYSNARQRLWVVDENGTLLKTHRVSGKTGWPGIGTFYVYSRSLNTFATHNPSIIWKYMVRFASGPNGGAIGFHEIPNKCSSNGCAPVQTVEQLGQPLSGGCVRQTTEDAIWMWDWAQIGTKVVVIDNG
jgi:lipoprotein-anchoring transpeptidase ErfK/SrfK